MRISDWSSDVCSSDLPVINRLFPGQIVEHYETTGIRDIGFDQAQEIAGKVRELFEAGAFDVAHLFYSKFRSALVQEATGQQLIPVPAPAQPQAPGGAAVEDEPAEEPHPPHLLPPHAPTPVLNGPP